MELLGEAVPPRGADRVRVALVPGRVLHLGHQRGGPWRFARTVWWSGTEVEADGVEQPSPGTEVGQHGNRTTGRAPGAFGHQVPHGLVEGDGRVTQEILAPEPDRGGPAGRPGRVEAHDVIDFGQVEEGHGHLVAERVGRPGTEAGVDEDAFVHGAA